MIGDRGPGCRARTVLLLADPLIDMLDRTYFTFAFYILHLHFTGISSAIWSIVGLIQRPCCGARQALQQQGC